MLTSCFVFLYSLVTIKPLQSKKTARLSRDGLDQCHLHGVLTYIPNGKGFASLKQAKDIDHLHFDTGALEE